MPTPSDIFWSSVYPPPPLELAVDEVLVDDPSVVKPAEFGDVGEGYVAKVVAPDAYGMSILEPEAEPVPAAAFHSALDTAKVYPPLS